MSPGVTAGFRWPIQHQPVGFGVIRENVAIPAPIQSCFNLTLDLLTRKMFVQNITKELQRQRMVGLTEKGAVHLLEQRDMSQRGVTEHPFPRANVCLRKFRA